MKFIALTMLCLQINGILQAQEELAARTDSIQYFGALTKELFSNWVDFWSRQNVEFDLTKVNVEYDTHYWKQQQMFPVRSTKFMSKADGSLVDISPDGLKYVQVCGFCSVAKKDDGTEETYADDIHGYLVVADLKSWKAKGILFWGMPSAVSRAQWIDIDRFMVVSSHVTNNDLRQPYYVLIDTKRQVNVHFISQILCAPPGE